MTQTNDDREVALDMITERIPVMLPNDPVVADFLEANGYMDAAQTLRGVVRPVHLWLIYATDDVGGYEYYDAAVVAAHDAEAARRIHPNPLASQRVDEQGFWVDTNGDHEYDGSWAQKTDLVTAECVGVADPTIEPGTVVLASYNAA